MRWYRIRKKEKIDFDLERNRLISSICVRDSVVILRSTHFDLIRNEISSYIENGAGCMQIDWPTHDLM